MTGASGAEDAQLADLSAPIWERNAIDARLGAILDTDPANPTPLPHAGGPMGAWAQRRLSAHEAVEGSSQVAQQAEPGRWPSTLSYFDDEPGETRRRSRIRA